MHVIGKLDRPEGAENRLSVKQRAAAYCRRKELKAQHITTPTLLISLRIKHSAAPLFSARLPGGKLTFVYAAVSERGQMSIFRVDMEGAVGVCWGWR